MRRAPCPEGGCTLTEHPTKSFNEKHVGGLINQRLVDQTAYPPLWTGVRKVGK